MIVDIVILSLTSDQTLYDMTKACIESLRHSESQHQFNVTVVESHPEYSSTRYPYDATVLTPKETFNYHRFCKIGLTHGANEWVALCNNDLIFQPGWFSAILKAAEAYHDVKSFSPWNNYNDWHASRLQEDKDFYPGFGIGYELTGWCLVAKREIFTTVELDDRVDFWFSDNVYADQLQKHGIKHGLVRQSYVDHIISKTLLTRPADEIQFLTEGQMAKYCA